MGVITELEKAKYTEKKFRKEELIDYGSDFRRDRVRMSSKIDKGC